MTIESHNTTMKAIEQHTRVIDALRDIVEWNSVDGQANCVACERDPGEHDDDCPFKAAEDLLHEIGVYDGGEMKP